MREERKRIIGFENYEISNYGIIYRSNGLVLKTQLQNSGYSLVHLRNKGKRKAFLVHRLVAIHFILNPFDKPQVNHKDCCKSNNRYDNLEWVTAKENSTHAVENGRIVRDNGYRERMSVIGKKYKFKNSENLRRLSIQTSKPVLQLTLTGDIVKEYASCKEARRLNPKIFNISSVVNGRGKTSGGFQWIHKSKYYGDKNNSLRKG